MLVHNLIFKTSSFLLGHFYKTLFRHLLRLFNYACSLIHILQKSTSDYEPMCLSSEFERLFLTSSHHRFESYVLSLSKFFIIQSSKQRRQRARKAKKGKTTYMETIKMFLHNEYLLQLQIVHHYYSGVQDTILQISTKVVYILRQSRLQELSTSRSSRPAKRGRKS